MEFYMITLKRFAIALVAVMPLAFTSVIAKAQDIVDTAIAAGQFGTLIAAVQAADLVEVLRGEGPLTVFAPTDEAFAALPEGTVENLLKPENKDQLIAILNYCYCSRKRHFCKCYQRCHGRQCHSSDGRH